jgi:hypothetical protein
VRGSIAESKLPHAYTGATSTEFSIGMKQAAAQSWFELTARARGCFAAGWGGVAMKYRGFEYTIIQATSAALGDGRLP